MPDVVIDTDLLNKLQIAANQAGISVEEYLTDLLDQSVRKADYPQRLKAIHRAGMALFQSKTLDELYRRAVQLGLDELGFDRMALFLLDQEENTIYGTYRTDPTGNVCEDDGFRQSLASQAHWLPDVLAPQNRAIIHNEVDPYDVEQVVGNGWSASAALWDGNQTIGYVTIDNLISQRPPHPYETELLSIYGATIGHAISHVRVELEMRTRAEHFLGLLEAAPVALLVIALEGRILAANAAAEKLFGYCPGECDGRMLETLLPDSLGDFRGSQAQRLFDHLSDFTAQMSVAVELQAQHKDGTSIPVDVRFGYIEGENETFVLAVVMDTAERKIAEKQQVAQALEEERSAVISAFIRDAAHEFRTPLAIIRTSLYLQGRTTEEDRRRELGDRIEEQADKILSLVENLSTMVRLENQTSGQAHHVNINSTVLRVVRAAQNALEKGKISLWLNLNESVPSIQGIAADVALALSCVVDNAIRYTAEGGSIIVETKLDGNDRIVVSVVDTGSGIPPEIQKRIFDQFYRADTAHSTPGLGLGLSIARKIVDQHRGSIEVESAPDQGSTFRIIFPTSETQVLP